ncbi:galanin receptor 2a-like [Haliotis cracherodii]|uniref:galanin receptor 2a-like n=1 Tax=Haliotis cracherodii TaxID=6455 RepID=UPI0039EBC832
MDGTVSTMSVSGETITPVGALALYKMDSSVNDTYTTLSPTDINTTMVYTSLKQNPRFFNGVVVSLFMTIGILGNTLVFCIQHFKCKPTTFSFFVKVLAVLDLMSCVVTMPIDIVVKTVPNLSSIDMFTACKTAHYFAYATSVSSGTVLLLIAVERYRKICQPLGRAIEPRLARILCAIAITVALSVSSLTTMVTGPQTIELNWNNRLINLTVCRAEEELKASPSAIALNVSLFAAFALILIFLIVFYTMICKKLRVQTEKRRSFDDRILDEQGDKRSFAPSEHVTKIFFIVTMVFIVSYLPHLILLLIRAIQTNKRVYESWERKLYELAYNSPYVNNIANPIIYSFLSSHFRQQCKETFGFRRVTCNNAM